MCTLRRVIGVVVMGLVLAAPVMAADQVSGHLTVDEDTATPAHAMAVWIESTAMWEKGKRILQVYMAATPLSSEGVSDALNPGDAIRDQIDDACVIVTLDADGSFHDIYAFFPDGGKNYGYNTGSGEQISIEKGAVSGRVFLEGEGKLVDSTISFDLSFSAEIVPERQPGKDLGEDGGAPGAAYLAYATAQRDGTIETLIKHAGKAEAERMASDDFQDWELESIKEMAPQEMQVHGGQLYEGYAIIEVAGKDWSGDKVEGKIKMVRDGDTWRFADEDLDLVW